MQYFFHSLELAGEKGEETEGNSGQKTTSENMNISLCNVYTTSALSCDMRSSRAL